MNISGKYKTQHGELIIAQHGDNITATYQENGICVGKLIGNKVEGIWKNKKDQGLFVWTFDDKGSFEGNYKSGIEKGPMRGKWNSISNGEELDQKKVKQLEFVVIQENGGKQELSFCISVSNINPYISIQSITSDEYYNIIMHKEVLEECYKVIEEKDSFLLENSDEYAMRLNSVDEEKLDFLWGYDHSQVGDQEKLSIFFNKRNESLNSEAYKELVEEFIQDSVCSLSYVKSFKS